MNSGCIPVLPSPLITAFVYDIWNSMHMFTVRKPIFKKEKKCSVVLYIMHLTY